MAKSYTERLASWVAEKNKNKRQDKNAVAVLAVKSDIEEAIAAGYAVKTIWEHMLAEGIIQCRYETFLKHVNRHIKTKKDSQTPKATTPKKEPSTKAATTPKQQGNATPSSPQKKTTNEPIRPAKQQSADQGFQYNATADKEELF